MPAKWLPFAAAVLAAAPLLAQATSEWSTAAGLPVAVVEVAGGDVEHLAALLPPRAVPPPRVAGFPTRSTARRGGVVASLSVPAILAGPAVQELAAALVPTGAAAVVVLGPAGAAELAGALAALERVPGRALRRQPCVLPEGGVELRRAEEDRVELRLAAPGPEDPRFDLLSLLAGWLEARLRPDFSGLDAGVELEAGCARLTLRLPVADGSPLAALRRLREATAGSARQPPAEEEVARAAETARRRLAAVARDGELTAVALAERLAGGGQLASALVLPAADADALAGLAATVLRGHPGAAAVYERERRAVAGTPELLANGVVLAWRWAPGEVGVAAVALGGSEPAAGRALLGALAGSAAAHGWAAEVADLLGVPAIAVATPSGELQDALEQLADAIARAPAGAVDGLDLNVAHALGLADRPGADAISVALMLPLEEELGREAAEKFFAALPAAPVRSAAVFPGAGLAWTRGEGAPTVAGLVELPANAPGVLAGAVLAARLEGTEGVRSRWLAPPARLVLEVRASGEAHVPALDARLARLWAAACRPAPDGEVDEAAHVVAQRLVGDAARVTARVAAAPFLPALPAPEALLSADASEVNAVLAALPRWESLARVARGPAPLLPMPPPARGVRESPPARRRGP